MCETRPIELGLEPWEESNRINKVKKTKACMAQVDCDCDIRNILYMYTGKHLIALLIITNLTSGTSHIIFHFVQLSLAARRVG